MKKTLGHARRSVEVRFQTHFRLLLSFCGFALGFSLNQASAETVLKKQVQFSYSQVINLDQLSSSKSFEQPDRDRLSGRFLISAQLTFSEPKSFVLYRHRVSDDMYPQSAHDEIAMVGDSLLTAQIQLQRINDNGQVVDTVALPENLKIQSLQRAHVGALADGQKGMGSVGGYIPQFSALSIEIPSASRQNQWLLSLLANISLPFVYHNQNGVYIFDGYEMAKNAPPLAIQRITLIKRNSDFSEATKFEESLIVPEGTPPDLNRCTAPGQIVPLHSFMFKGQLMRRVEYCYPTGQPEAPVTRLILPIGFTQTHTTEEMKSTNAYMTSVRSGLPNVQLSHPLYTIQPEDMAKMNCHSYALRAVLGHEFDLPANSLWVEGKASEFSNGTHPFIAVLKKHFKWIAGSDKTNPQINNAVDREGAERAVDTLYSQALPGDLIVLSDGEDAVHSGVLVRVPGQERLWIESKYNEREVITVPLENLGTYHDGIFSNAFPYTRVDIFRKK